MENKHVKEYRKFKTISLADRTWPDKEITQAPIWCSVDLRDGNQALPKPMGIREKMEMFLFLKNMGFKEIEIGFPSASETEYRFLRKLIDEGATEGVTIQVLTQAREHLIKRTFEALKGVEKAIVHVYNSTSTQQRNMVFRKSQAEIKDIAIAGAKMLVEEAAKYPETEFIFEYSPESFTGTEMEYAVDVCNAVIDVWQPTPEKKCILNIPATVEMSSPNVYADQVEWFCRNIDKRDSVLVSLHAHNDRGTAVAATELAMLAGADRVEGTLFGNGERTGNVDILNVAMNMYSQGIDPQIYVEQINEITKMYKRCTGMDIHDRHPYAGALVYTAFSGSHQDAIRKGLEFNKENNSIFWDVPYLPLNPDHIGRKYEPIIRINSQSGKGGVAFILEQEFGYKLPKKMHPEVSVSVQKVSDDTGKELKPNEIFEIFSNEFVNVKEPLSLVSFKSTYKDDEKDKVKVKGSVLLDGEEKSIRGMGNGPISAFFNAIKELGYDGYKLIDYTEHAISDGADAIAAAYIVLSDKDGIMHYGVGTDANINKASVIALISALNRFA
ncbi:2-isopropylmalate synthase [Clostridia bacterium]|nr:2-isopropylmalate synthase [Clostridia bacterium]